MHNINFAKDSNGQWSLGVPYPISVEGHTMLSISEYIYVFGKLNILLTQTLFFIGGINFDENYDQWTDSARYNTKLVYRNADPAESQWEKHADLLRPRASHSTVLVNDQVFHIAGWAKDYSVTPSVLNSRKVEKWEQLSGDTKIESRDVFFNYVSPQSFIVTESWYRNCV